MIAAIRRWLMQHRINRLAWARLRACPRAWDLARECGCQDPWAHLPEAEAGR